MRENNPRNDIPTNRVDRSFTKAAVLALRLTLAGGLVTGVTAASGWNPFDVFAPKKDGKGETPAVIAKRPSDDTFRIESTATATATRTAVAVPELDGERIFVLEYDNSRLLVENIDPQHPATYMNYLIESCQAASTLALSENSRPKSNLSFLERVWGFLGGKTVEAAPLEVSAETAEAFVKCIQDIEKERPFLSNLEEVRPQLGRRNIDVQSWDASNVIGLDSIAGWRKDLAGELRERGFDITPEIMGMFLGDRVQITFRNPGTGGASLFTAQILDDKAEVDRRRAAGDRTVHWSGERVWVAFDTATQQIVATLENCDNELVPAPVVPLPTPTPVPPEETATPQPPPPPEATATPQPAPGPEATPTREATATPQPPPEATPTPTREATATPQPVPDTPTPVPTREATATPQPVPVTSTPVPTREATATPQPVPDTPTPVLPTAVPPTVVPTREATATPQPVATAASTPIPPAPTPIPPAPTPAPTREPRATPSGG